MFFREHHFVSSLSLGWSACTTCNLIPSGCSPVTTVRARVLGFRLPARTVRHTVASHDMHHVDLCEADNTCS